jgi:hypothetical protein
MRKHLKQLLLATAFTAALALAFAAYLQPSFMLDLANRIILCF